jgi:hypothetical protein
VLEPLAQVANRGHQRQRRNDWEPEVEQPVDEYSVECRGEIDADADECPGERELDQAGAADGERTPREDVAARVGDNEQRPRDGDVYELKRREGPMSPAQ